MGCVNGIDLELAFGQALNLDLVQILQALMLALLCGAFVSVIYRISIPDRIVSPAMLVSLVLLSVINRTGSTGSETTTLFEWLSWNEHLFWFLHGVVRASDLLYFLLFTVFFLALAHRRLANRRLG